MKIYKARTDKIGVALDVIRTLKPGYTYSSAMTSYGNSGITRDQLAPKETACYEAALEIVAKHLKRS